MEASWPLVSIVFLAFNRRDELAVSLEHVLERLDYPPDQLEVIVIDNASTDGTAEMVRDRFPMVELIRQPENIGASAWNVGMTTARGDWRLILDDDCYIAGQNLKTAVRRAEEHDADFVSFHVVSGRQAGYSFQEEYKTGLLSFWGCAAMFSHRVIENEPFYDPRIFIWANEMELTIRLLDRGYRHLYLPEVEPVHMRAPSPRFMDFTARMNARHFAYIAAKLLRPRDAVGAIANVLLHLLIQAYGENPRALLVLPEIPTWVIKGLRARAPARPEVSRIYRHHTWHFVSPMSQVRSPLERIRHRGADDAERARLVRSERWYERHRTYYPKTTSVLAL